MVATASPATLTRYLVSWNKKLKRFRWRNASEEHVVRQARGQGILAGTDNVNLRIHMDCYVESCPDGVLEISAPDPGIVVPQDAQFLGEGKWRLCARVPEHDWRLRYEGGTDLYYVNTYRGYMNVQWDDGKAHLFHIGRAYLHQGVAYLVP